MRDVLAKLNGDNHALALQLASLPEQIRGYGHVKEPAVHKVKEREAGLLAAFRNPAPQASAAE